MTETRIFVEGQENEFEDFIFEKKYDQIILIADARTNGFCLPILKNCIPVFKVHPILVVPAGEENKTLDTCSYLWSQLQQLLVTKKSLLISVGGGALSDLVGLAASLYKRGIDVIHIPTTLLAMVDASHGGKTAIDFHDTKNLVGTFHMPKAIYLNPIFLKSLSERVLYSGCAEMIKHALLHSKKMWNQVLSFSFSDFTKLESIQSSIEVKTVLVKQDPNDEGIRQALNFGHSVGHAIESSLFHSKSALLHGEAIMIGMQIELQLSTALLGMPSVIQSEFNHLKQRLYPNLKPVIHVNKVISHLQQDKKNDHSVRMSLLHDIGKPALQIPVSLEDIQKAFYTYDHL